MQASEPGRLDHSFDQDPRDPQSFVWSEVDASSLRRGGQQPSGSGRSTKHAELGDGFNIEVYGTVGAE